VLDLLNELTYGQNSPPELLEGREWWLAQKPVGRWQEALKKRNHKPDKVN